MRERITQAVFCTGCILYRVARSNLDALCKISRKLPSYKKGILKKGFDQGMLPQHRKAIYFFFFVQRPFFPPAQLRRAQDNGLNLGVSGIYFTISKLCVPPTEDYRNGDQTRNRSASRASMSPCRLLVFQSYTESYARPSLFSLRPAFIYLILKFESEIAQTSALL